MPQPWTYRHATREYRAFLDDVKDRMGLVSSNNAYTAVDGVFQVFRRRLTAQQGLDFASVLPAVPRAIFVAGWKPKDPPLLFEDRDTLTREVQALRLHHNLTPDNAIEATAWALRRAVRATDLDRVLNQLPPPAQDFWAVPETDPPELEQRIR